MFPLVTRPPCTLAGRPRKHGQLRVAKALVALLARTQQSASALRRSASRRRAPSRVRRFAIQAYRRECDRATTCPPGFAHPSRPPRDPRPSA
eukprot:scaffold8130_cov69-Phaeocystis_antarctica.AAC.12